MSAATPRREKGAHRAERIMLALALLPRATEPGSGMNRPWPVSTCGRAGTPATTETLRLAGTRTSRDRPAAWHSFRSTLCPAGLRLAPRSENTRGNADRGHHRVEFGADRCAGLSLSSGSDGVRQSERRPHTLVPTDFTNQPLFQLSIPSRPSLHWLWRRFTMHGVGGRARPACSPDWRRLHDHKVWSWLFHGLTNTWWLRGSRGAAC